MRPLVLLGGGEHARVVLDAARSQADLWTVVGFVDPQPRAELQALGVPWLGDDDAVRPDAVIPAGDSWYIVAVGGLVDTAVRRRVAEARGDVAWATVIHQRAVVSAYASIGPGTAVLASAVINPGATVAEHCIVNSGAIIEHDVRLEPFAHVGPGAVLGGGAVVGAGALVGLGARVRDHIRIGAGAVVAMGAVVVEPVADGAVVAGVPARVRP